MVAERSPPGEAAGLWRRLGNHCVTTSMAYGTVVVDTDGKSHREDSAEGVRRRGVCSTWLVPPAQKSGPPLPYVSLHTNSVLLPLLCLKCCRAGRALHEIFHGLIVRHMLERKRR